MNIRSQIFIDRTFFRPAVFLMNYLMRLGKFLVRRDHSLDRDFKKIAVCKFKGMGSIIHATPLLQTLRKKYPGAKIIFVTSERNRAIVGKISCVDEMICLKDDGLVSLLLSAPRFLGRLILFRIEVYLDLEIYSDFSSLVATLSLAGNRVGFYLRSSHYRLGIYTHMMFYNIKAPIYQAYLQMGRLLHCDELVNTLYPLQSASGHLETGGGASLDLEKTAYIAVNANASDLRSERRWGEENFAALIEQVLRQYPAYRILLIGNRQEKAYVDRLIQRFEDKKKIINLAGMTTIDQLIAVLQHARILISNDTGPLHLAHAVGTPTVALFGPCSPAQYGHPRNNYILYHNLYCSPCVHEFTLPPCRGDNQCMKRIGVEEVLAGVHHFISSENKEGDRDRKAGKPIYSTREDGNVKILGFVRR